MEMSRYFAKVVLALAATSIGLLVPELAYRVYHSFIKIEAPTFEQIFRNEELRREFEALTRKLDQPTS